MLVEFKTPRELGEVLIRLFSGFFFCLLLY